MDKGTFLSADKKTEVCYYFFDEIKEKPKAIIQISHGMQDYILRYKDLIDYLNHNNIIVCGIDDLGHGATSKSSKTDGFFAHKNGYKLVAKDLFTMCKLAKDKYNGVPYFMLGHSMGSFFARYFAYLYPNELDGLILCGTSGKVVGTGFGIKLLSLIKFFRGEKSYCTLIENIMLKKYFKYIDTVVTRREWVTSDGQKLKKYEHDPRSTFRFTASAYQDMLRVLKFVNTKKWAKGIRKDLPIFICSGAKDPVGNYGKGVAWVYGLLEKQKINSIKLNLYENVRHELHNETTFVRDVYFNDIINWVNNVLNLNF